LAKIAFFQSNSRANLGRKGWQEVGARLARLAMNEEGTTTTELTGCQLGRELGECPLRGKCDSLYDVLLFSYPPLPILAAALGSDDPQVRAWARRMDQLLTPTGPEWMFSHRRD
jgi:hypothetical protein